MDFMTKEKARQRYWARSFVGFSHLSQVSPCLSVSLS
jgi:hypothetical protein